MERGHIYTGQYHNVRNDRQEIDNKNVAGLDEIGPTLHLGKRFYKKKHQCWFCLGLTVEHSALIQICYRDLIQRTTVLRSDSAEKGQAGHGNVTLHLVCCGMPCIQFLIEPQQKGNRNLEAPKSSNQKGALF